MITRRFFVATAIALCAGPFLLGPAGCRRSSNAPPSAPVDATTSDFPKGSPKFEKSYRSALAEAKKSGKPVIVVFSASWCGPCQQMKKNTYPSAEVTPMHDKFVWAYLDTDEEANAEVAKQFKVAGIPHIEFLDKEGKSLGNQVGSAPAPAFAKTLEGILKKAGGKAAE